MNQTSTFVGDIPTNTSWGFLICVILLFPLYIISSFTTTIVYMKILETLQAWKSKFYQHKKKISTIQDFLLEVKNPSIFALNVFVTWQILYILVRLIQEQDTLEWTATFTLLFVLTGLGIILATGRVLSYIRKVFMEQLSHGVQKVVHQRIPSCKVTSHKKTAELKEVVVEQEEKQESAIEEQKEMEVTEQLDLTVLQQIDIFDDIENIGSNGLSLSAKDFQKFESAESFLQRHELFTSEKKDMENADILEKQQFIQELKKSEPGQRLFNWGVQLAIGGLFLYFALIKVGLDTYSLWTTIAGGSVIIAFSFQEVLKNVFVSLMFLIDRTFQPGDILFLLPPHVFTSASGDIPSTSFANILQRNALIKGIVERIGLRYTKIVPLQTMERNDDFEDEENYESKDKPQSLFQQDEMRLEILIPNTVLSTSVLGRVPGNQPNLLFPCFKEYYSQSFPIKSYWVLRNSLKEWTELMRQTEGCLPQLTHLVCEQKQASQDCVLIGTFAASYKVRSQQRWFRKCRETFSTICRCLQMKLAMDLDCDILKAEKSSS